MNSEILAVGTELLMGMIANTNAKYISEKLNEIGINVYYHSVVGDNPKRMSDSFKISMNRADLIITTGGLGPTEDDLTKEIISDVLHRELLFNEDIMDSIKEYFERNKREMTDNNKKQAYMPKGSIIIPNKVGTACGFIIEEGSKIIIMLPGPPKELQPMFSDTVIPYLRAKTNSAIESMYLKIFGLGEAQVCDRIKNIINEQTDPTIAPYCGTGEVTIRLTTKSGRKILKDKAKEIIEILGDYVYSEDGSNLEEVVVDLLKEKGKTIALAESCTGGMLSSKITNVSGASQVLNRGIVSYSNIAKIENLNVPEHILEEYGAVSEQTAEYMAIGVRNVAKTDIGVSVTGIAGPTGGTKEKPVGLVYIGFSDKEKVIVKKLQLDVDREKIRELACKNLLDLIRREV